MSSIAAPQHDVFNGSSSNTNIFPNDFTSANEVDRHTRLAAEAKAEREKIEQEKKELDDLRTLCIAHEKEKAQLVKDKKWLWVENSDLMYKMKELNDQISKLMGSSSPYGQHFGLDPACHGRPAQLVLLANMKSALDCGKDGGAAAHGWTFGLDYTWQKLTLWRVEPSNPVSAWLIQSKCNSYLEMVSEQGYEVRMNKDRREGKDKEMQQWLIGRDAGQGIVLFNEGCERFLCMDEPLEDKTGKELYGDRYTTNDQDALRWQLIIW